MQRLLRERPMPDQVRGRIRQEEAARKERLARLARQLRPVVEAIHRLREAQATGVGADQVLAAAELAAAEVVLAEVVEVLEAEAALR